MLHCPPLNVPRSFTRPYHNFAILFSCFSILFPSCRRRALFIGARRSDALHPLNCALRALNSRSAPVVSLSSRFVKRHSSTEFLMSSGQPSGSQNTLTAYHTKGPHISIELCFLLPGTPYAVQPLRKSMNRGAALPAAQTLERIRLLLAPPPPKLEGKKDKTKTNKGDRLGSCPEAVVLGVRDDAPHLGWVELDPQLPNSVFWKRARQLCIAGKNIEVLFNFPRVISIGPLPVPHVGTALFCIDIKVLSGGPYELYYEWSLDNGEKQVLSTEPIFTPTADLEFQVITLRLSADPDRRMWEEVKSPRVKPAQERMDRWDATLTFAKPPHFRVVTYNILYDGFCTNRLGRTQIYSFCTEDMLKEHLRALRIRRELMEYHADIICLQECGHRIFTSFFVPSFTLLGYEGLYFKKSGRTDEGCGYLIYSKRFKVLQQSSMPCNWESLAERQPEIAENIASHPELKEALTHMTAIGTGVRLKDCVTGRTLVVGNTHLFYHPDGCHLRILQGWLQMLHLHALSLEEGKQDPIIFCGDCNCTRTTGAYQLFTTGRVEAEHHSWAKGKLFWWGCEKKLGDAVDGEFENGEEWANTLNAPPPPPFGEKFFHDTLVAPFKMTNSYDFCTAPLPWTNYAKNFKEVLDYILFTDGAAEVIQAVPIPAEEELSRNCALPNDKYPSDHVALISDLKLL